MIKRLIRVIVFVLFVSICFQFVTDRASAAVVTWDGGGTDGTCGGGAGDGNKWSCGANWSTDAIPTTADVATFDGTSTKDATIDSSITVQGIDINSGYTGTVTQASTVTITTTTTTGFAQDDGVFSGGDSAILIDNGPFVLGAGADFTSTSGTLTVDRNFTIDSSATFAHGSGTIEIAGYNAGQDTTMSCGSKTLNNVSLAKTYIDRYITISSDCSFSIGNSPTSQGRINVYGTLTVGTGTWTHTGHVYVYTGGVLTASMTNLTAEGDFRLEGGTLTANSMTTMDLNGNGRGGLYLTSGTFNVSSLTNLNINDDLNNSGNLLPSGLTLTIDGTYSDPTLTCGTATFATPVTISKYIDRVVTINSDCSLNLGNSPTSSGRLNIYGNVTVGTGTWTHTGHVYVYTGGVLTASMTNLTAEGDFRLEGGTLTANSMTTMDLNGNGRGGLYLTSGTFNVSSLTNLNINDDLNNSGNLLPSGLTLTIDGTYSDPTLTCGTATFATPVTITKNNLRIVTVNSDCTLNLGNSPSTSGGINNSGNITVGTGTWTQDGPLTFTAGTVSASITDLSVTGNFTFSGGTLTANSMTDIYVYNGNVNLDSGTLNASSLTNISFERNFSDSGSLLLSNVGITLIGNQSSDTGVITCGAGKTFGSITVNATYNDATKKFSGECTSTGNFTLTDGYILNSDAATNLYIQGNASFSQTDAFGGANLTFNLTGGNTQTLAQNSSFTFSSPLVINKSGNQASLTTSFVTTGATCTVVEGTFDINGNTFTCGSTFSIEDGGTLQLEGDESVTTPSLASGSTVSYKGNGDTNPDSYTLLGWSYHHLAVNMTDSNDTLNGTATNPLTIPGNFSLNAGIFSAPATMNVAGNWNGGGTLTHNSGTVVLNGSGQSISGDTTFYNLTKSVASSDTLTFAAGSTQTITGTMTLSGADSNLLSLRSSSTDTQWEIDPQGTRTISYLDVQDSNNVNATAINAIGTNTTDSGNNTNWTFTNPATVSPPGSITQSTGGDGLISFTTTVSDADSENTKLKVEYSDDDGSTWYSAYLSSVTPSTGSVDVDNGQAYQVGSSNAIDTSSGSVDLTIVWDTKNAGNGGGSLDNTDQSDIKLRLVANDSIQDGATQTSSAFSLDNVAPGTFSGLSSISSTINTIELSWTAATDDNFSHYEIWYGTSQSDVENRTGTASEWDDTDDSLLGTITTVGTTITGLIQDTLYWIKSWAVDLFGNDLGSDTIQVSTLSPTPTATPTPVSTSTTSGTPTPTPTPGVCTLTPPKKSPNIIKLEPAETSVDVYLTPVGGKVGSYTVYYTWVEANIPYSLTTYIGKSSGAIKIVVNDLLPGQTYRFQAQALNDCAAGPLSDPESTITLGAATPTPTPTPTITPTPTTTPTPSPTEAVTEEATGSGDTETEPITETWLDLPEVEEVFKVLGMTNLVATAREVGVFEPVNIYAASGSLLVSSLVVKSYTLTPVFLTSPLAAMSNIYLGIVPGIPALSFLYANFHALILVIADAIMTPLGIYRKRKKTLGIVFDSVTLKPIAHAHILFHSKSGNLYTTYSNASGRYYIRGNPDEYQVTVTKPGYNFPSKIQTKPSSPIFARIYQPETTVTLTQEPEFSLALPMDPLSAEHQAFHKLMTLINTYFFGLIQKLVMPLFICFTVASILVLITQPSWWAVLSVVIGLVFLTYDGIVFFRRRNKLGTLMRGDKPAAFFGLILYKKTEATKEYYTSTDTDDRGRYLFVPENGIYDLYVSTLSGEQLLASDIHVTDKFPSICEHYNLKNIASEPAGTRTQDAQLKRLSL